MATICTPLNCDVASDFQIFNNDGFPASLLPLPAPPTIPAPLQCLALNCDVEADLRTYSLDGLPALPLPPSPIPLPMPYSNEEVYYAVSACGLGQELTVVPASAKPGWITLDSANSRLIGAAGTFRGNTRAQANATAASNLAAFATAAIANGTLICAPIALVLFFDDFESYTDGVAVNGLGEGNWTDLPSPYVDV